MTPEARAARERKQKIFIAVGGLFLVAMLAFQLPKLLGGSPSPEAASSTETATTPVQLPGAPVALGEAPRTPAASTAKLRSFSEFDSKDPFVQQVKTESGVTGDGGTPAAGGKGEKATGAKTFATGPKAAAATIVTVNGARQVLVPGMRFPAADPLFLLVAEKPGAKSVVVGIVGGAYTGGRKRTTLKVGKPLTLVNTTTGARYKIALVSVGSGDQTKQSSAAKP